MVSIDALTTKIFSFGVQRHSMDVLPVADTTTPTAPMPSVDDPKLAAVLDAIELRATVELAKLERQRGS